MSVALAESQVAEIRSRPAATFVDGIAMASADDQQLPALLSFLDHEHSEG